MTYLTRRVATLDDKFSFVTGLKEPENKEMNDLLEVYTFDAYIRR